MSAPTSTAGLTVGQLREFLSAYPDHFTVADHENREFRHISNAGGGGINSPEILILSTEKPIGQCNRTGEYVFPTDSAEYAGVCTATDESLYSFEFSQLEESP